MLVIEVSDAEILSLLPPIVVTEEMVEFILQRLPGALLNHLEDEIERLALDYLDQRYLDDHR